MVGNDGSVPFDSDAFRPLICSPAAICQCSNAIVIRHNVWKQLSHLYGITVETTTPFNYNIIRSWIVDHHTQTFTVSQHQFTAYDLLNYTRTCQICSEIL